MISALSSSARGIAPDLIVLNASVRTLDPKQPQAEAVAILGNRIVAVGTSEEVGALKSAHTRIIDAKGNLLLPGFNDAHVHFLTGGFQLSRVDLRDATTPEEFGRRLGEYARKLPKGAWVLGGNWDHENWPGAPLPTKEMIDPFTGETPVFVSRLDGHMAVANSAALHLARITPQTPSPKGGLIITNKATGEPTGLLKDAAMGLVLSVVPASTFEEKLQAARAASEYAASLGVTSVQDMSAGQDIGVYQELHRRGELKTRIYGMNPLPEWERLAQAGIRAPFGNETLRIGGLKGFSDGSLGSTTAWFFEPYNDAPEFVGLPADEMFPEGVMAKRVQAAGAAGLHVMIHAIGDQANHYILNVFEEAQRRSPGRDLRFRIEHAQHLRKDDIVRFGKLKVIPSMQPYHAADDGRWAEKRIGPGRINGTYAFRSLLESGAQLAFGSDWTVAPLNPLLGIHAAVTRKTLDGKHPEGWVPEEKITVDQAIRAYTLGSAYAEFAEEVKGSISVGKLADLVLLDQDLYSIDPDQILQSKVLCTVFNGKVVFERKEK